MSTRCQIGFYQSEQVDLRGYEALLYRHSDGYPGKANGSESGVLAEIVPFLNHWQTVMGMDELEYLAARLLQHLCNEYDKQGVVFSKRGGYVDTSSGILGYGICNGLYSDIDYYYAISPGLVRVFKPHFGMKAPYPPLWNEWELLGTVNIAKEEQRNERRNHY